MSKPIALDRFRVVTDIESLPEPRRSKVRRAVEALETRSDEDVDEEAPTARS